MRHYSSTASGTTLAVGASSSATSITVASTSGLPIQYPYTLSIDADNPSKELVEVTDATGVVLTVTRGIDGTSATDHSIGAQVSHDHSARDFRESREHEAATSAHGVSGTVVGTSDTQTLTNKDLSHSSNTLPSNVVKTSGAQTVTGKDLSSGNTFPTSLVTTSGAQSVTGKDLSSGNTFPSSLVTTSGTQTVTGKDLSSGNTFPSSLVTTSGTQTLTNKTLTSPIINLPDIRFPTAGSIDWFGSDLYPGTYQNIASNQGVGLDEPGMFGRSGVTGGPMFAGYDSAHGLDAVWLELAYRIGGQVTVTVPAGQVFGEVTVNHNGLTTTSWITASPLATGAWLAQPNSRANGSVKIRVQRPDGATSGSAANVVVTWMAQ